MPDPRNPNDIPAPPTWMPPVEEPDEEEQLPDEKRGPNPDENEAPPMKADERAVQRMALFRRARL